MHAHSVLVYIWALLGFEGLSLGIIECLIFGSTLSATDPVTVVSSVILRDFRKATPLNLCHISSLPSSTP